MNAAESEHEVERRLVEDWPVREWGDSHVLAAVSGGPDSVAMLRGLVSVKAAAGGAGKLYVAHLNHQMRGKASNEDEQWVRSLCERLGLPFFSERTDVAAISREQGDGWEAAARCARYTFFRRAAEELGARYVATGHTADDQVETILHRIIRGTGLDGLAGVRRARPLSVSIVLVRPLLSVPRREVLQYLAAIGQEYRRDESNDDSSFTRNRIRRELLPALREKYNQGVDDALLRLASQAADAQDVIAALAGRLTDESITVKNHVMQIDCRQLANEHLVLVRAACRVAWARAGWPEQAMTFEKWNLLARATRAGFAGSFNLPGNIRAVRDAGTLLLER